MLSWIVTSSACTSTWTAEAYISANAVPSVRRARIIISSSLRNAVMHTYINTLNLGPMDVDYRVEKRQVIVKSVHSDGDDITAVLSEDARLSLAQQIQDSIESGY